MSTRKTPILLRIGPLSGRIFAVTRYTVKRNDDGSEYVDAHEKHDVTDQFGACMAELEARGLEVTPVKRELGT
jgi:hypothetical protein